MKSQYERYFNTAKSRIEQNPTDIDIYRAWFDLIRELGETDRNESIREMYRFREKAQFAARMQSRNISSFVEYVKKSYLYCAPYRFDDFLIYNEWRLIRLLIS